MGVLCMSCSSNAQKQSATAPEEEAGSKVLVAYFSCTGTTQKVAEAIADTLAADLYQITPAVAYTPEDLDWTNDQSRSSVEMGAEDCRPELAGDSLSIEGYDLIFLGYPIWWNLAPRAVNTFLESYDFTGKKVIPFATSGSSSITNSAEQLKNLYPDIVWGEGKLLNGGTEEAGPWAEECLE